MIGQPSLGALWRVEVRKLLSRGPVRLSLLLAVLLGSAGPLGLSTFLGLGFEVNGQPVSQWMGLEPSAGLGLIWSLQLRNGLIMPLFLVWVAATSLAGELQDRTLREDLLRPVGRAQLLTAKWLALNTWLAGTLLLTWVSGLVLGALLHGASGEWDQLAAGYLVSGLCDATLAALVLAAASLMRSVATTLVLLVLAWVGSGILSVALSALSALLSTPLADRLTIPPWITFLVQTARPWLPNEALAAWQGFAPNTPWQPEHFASLVLMTLLALLVAERRLTHTDLP